ncbi:60S ribosomal protein L29 [Tilletia horrida]|uniref:60S ribosomal protein L29 n=1 Tax=Tilletia horrida TaxID=155126 RepID=A0AAN6JQS9_9BASI|nr:60S ribosomal protein L29 [Tilletia horrida]KAK0549435.1 60S ribosomal protein L29 [Tilletia horrida]
MPLTGAPLRLTGIKKPKSNKYPSLKGVDPKFVRNQRYAKHGTEKAIREARAAAVAA